MRIAQITPKNVYNTEFVLNKDKATQRNESITFTAAAYKKIYYPIKLYQELLENLATRIDSTSAVNSKSKQVFMITSQLLLLFMAHPIDFWRLWKL